MAKKAPTKKKAAAVTEHTEVAKAPEQAAAVIAEPAKLAQAAAQETGVPERTVEPAVPPAPTKGREPTPEEIARRAHELYLARGGRNGGHVDDWLEAERELRQGT